MTLTELLVELSVRGIKIWVEDDRLQVRVPGNILTPVLREALQQHKATILQQFHQMSVIHQGELEGPTQIQRSEVLPLTSAQEELWLVEHFQQGDAAFKVAYAFHLRGQLDQSALKKSIDAIIARHEILRTTFPMVDGKPAQVVHASLQIPFKVIDVTDLPVVLQEQTVRHYCSQENARLFDLQHGPLLSAHLFLLNPTEHILHVATHHIIFDAWSINLFLQELVTFYTATIAGQLSPLSPLAFQYADFAIWQQYTFTDEALHVPLQYWRQHLADAPTLLQLPLDHPRSTGQTFQRRQIVFNLSTDLSVALRALSRNEGTTLYTTLVAAYQTLLFRYSGQKDIVIGSPTSGRSRPETKDMLGSFAYPLVLRTRLDECWSFKELLKHTRTCVLDAYAHQEVPFIKVVEAVRPARSTLHTPLFQAMFTFPPAIEPIRLTDLEIFPIEDQLELTANYDLVLGMMDGQDRLYGRFLYNGDLFDETTIIQMQQHFLTLLTSITTDPQQLLQSPSLLTEERVQFEQPLQIDTQRIERTLCQMDVVADAVVRMRYAQSGKGKVIAYVVLTRPLVFERLSTLLESFLPSSYLPSAYVPLASLPLLPDGQVDEAMLLGLEILDNEVVERFQNQLQMTLNTANVAVVMQRQWLEPALLHLSDVLFKEKGEISDAEQSVSRQKQDVVSVSSTERVYMASEYSLVDGGSLRMDTLPSTLGETLARAARLAPGYGISYMHLDGTLTFQSYTRLFEDAKRIMVGLRKLGLQVQDNVLFQFEGDYDFIPAFWGCILGGFVPVPVAVPPSYQETGSAIEKLLSVWTMLGKPLILSTASLAPAIREFAERENLQELRTAILEDLQINEPKQDWHICQPDDIALMMLTSGSTGQPKGVLLSHHNLIFHSAGSQQMNHFSQTDITLNWMPLDHVAGLIYFHLRDVFLGCQQFHMPTIMVLQDPLLWIDWLHQYRISITFAPNFAFGLVNDRVQAMTGRQWDLSSLRFILNGAEAIVARTARRFLQVLEPFGLSSHAMYPAWGMSETSSGVVYFEQFRLETTSDEDSFVEVGRPIPGCAIRIVDEQNQMVETGIIGHLQIRGLTVTRGYYGFQKHQQETFTQDGWFDTGDLGLIRGGSLTITGRAKDVIVINSVNYYCHEIEALVETISSVETSYTAACGVRLARSETDTLVIFFHLLAGTEVALLEVIKEIRRTVGQRIGIYPDYVIPVEREAIPKTTIGKIQRVQLKQSFEAGEFSAILKHLDLLSANGNTLRDWFYQRVWRPKALRSYKDAQPGLMLLFLDQYGLGNSLGTYLQSQSQPYISVEPAKTFARLDDYRYLLNPAQPDHYQQLCDSLIAAQIYPESIAHFWTYELQRKEPPSQERLDQAQLSGSVSLLNLIQALPLIREKRPDRQIRLLVISSNAQPVVVSEPLAYEYAPLLGMMGAIAQEMPWLKCLHLDLSISEHEQNKISLIKELQALPYEQEVAYRYGQRLIPRIAEVHIGQEPPQPPPFRQEGVYLLTGGLGGIGVIIARYLLKQYQARLLLIGRTSLEDSELYRLRFLELQQLGGDVLYCSANVCDIAQISDAIAQAKSRWTDPIDGVLHMAGVFTGKLLREEVANTFLEALQAKMQGTRVLHDLLLRERPDGLFLHFSSVNAFLGGVGVGSYAAGNRALEHFSWHQQHHSSLKSYCFSWSMWDEIGVSQGYQLKDFSQAYGYYALTSKEAQTSLLIGLSHAYHSLLIGLNQRSEYIRRYAELASPRVQHLRVYVSSSSKNCSSLPQEEVILDAFGNPCVYEKKMLSVIPLRTDGRIDRERLLLLESTSPTDVSSDLTPRTEIEQAIIKIWQELLQVDKIGVNDNFFELGGHSILMAQTHRRLQETLHMSLQMVDLLKYPNVASLATFLNQSQMPANSSTQQGAPHRVAERRASLQQQRQDRQKSQSTKARREIFYE